MSRMFSFNVTGPHPWQRFRMDLELNMDNPSEAYIIENFNKTSFYEPEMSRVMFKVIRRGDYVVDVGANVGFFTVFMSKLVGPIGQVFAFEPGDNNLPSLKLNLSLNKVGNVTLSEQPLWCAEEEVTFHHCADGTGGNSLWDAGLWWENKKTRENPNTKKVMATTLDSIVDKHPFRLIKLDTEGVEQKILEGATDILKNRPPPFILLELNPFGAKQFGCDAETLRSFLRQFGYECFLIYAEGGIPVFVPPHTEITYQNGVAVLNVLFSTIEEVGKAWPKVPFE